jgi:hypothetical protein
MDLSELYFYLGIIYLTIGIAIVILFILACRDFVVIRRNTTKTQKLLYAMLKWQIDKDEIEWKKIKDLTRRDMDLSAFDEEKKITVRQKQSDTITKSKRYCQECGREIPSDANICPYCGKRF